MLSFLKISDLAILEAASLEPGPGFNVLTGETGAGKSIVVDAIGLLLGERGSGDLIRSGCDRLVVEGQFDLSGRPDVAAAIRWAGVEPDPGGDLLIRRELVAQGGSLRSRAMVNGQLVTLSALATIGASLVDLHGQGQHQSLLRTEGQRDALDRYAGAMDLREAVASRYGRIQDLLREQADLTLRERDRARQEEILSREIEEIDAMAPRAGEETDLLRQESLLRHASEVRRLAAEAFALLSDDDDAAITRLAGAQQRAEKLIGFDPRAAQTLSGIEQALAAASEAARELTPYLETGELDPGGLDQVASRLASLGRLKRRYGPSLEQVLAHRDNAAAELAALGGTADRLEAIGSELEEARAQYRLGASELSGRRARAGQKLAKGMLKELEALAMEATRVKIAVTTDASADPGPFGQDSVEFLISPNAGEELRPLARIASGGELSRLMLAVRNVTDAMGAGVTLVFDEVDSGIGGRVAESVGRRLAALGKTRQVLCVTHLPQIASFADRHFSVHKSVSGSRTRAHVALLEEAGRVEELARMLGDAPARTARQHAAALIGRSARKGGAAT